MATPSSTGEQELRIFLSYRRSDCQPQANGLYDGLRNRLPDARVFMDIDSIPAGVDFEEHIQREISVYDLVLVMIGDNWLDARPGSDTRRIDEPDDFVRLEIETALSSPQVRTLPVLVENAQMPRASEMPDSIARLARVNAIELSDMRWPADLDRLVDAVEALGLAKGKIVASPAPTQAPPAAPAPVQAPPVARTSLSIGAVGNVGQDPGEVRPVAPSGLPGEARTPAIAYLMMALPVLSVGMLAWVPAVWAGLKRRVGDPVRMRLLVVAGALGAAIVMAVALPTDLGAALWIACVGVGTAVAVLFRKPPPSQ